MKKKKSGGGGANWMDTYGDMVTLLLCFFVLLYSMSTISEEAWKNLVMSFNPYAVLSGDDRGGGGPSNDGDEQGVMPPDPLQPTDGVTQNDIDEKIEDLFEQIASMLSAQGLSDSVSATLDGGKIYLNFTDTTFFGPNSPELLAEALPILDELSKLFEASADAIDEIRIQGHTAQGTPGRYNETSTDRKLSSNRATNVLIYIQDSVDWDILEPRKLRAEGLGQWFPRASNENAAGRAMNRRVEIIISGRDLEQEALSGKLESHDTPSYTT